MARQIKNNAVAYGFITKKLHLIIALVFILQYILIYVRRVTAEGTDLNLQLILLHKSFGFSLLLIGLFFIVWRFLNTKPQYPLSMARWEIVLAKATQHTLYLLILLMPLSGTIMSLSSGRGILWFGWPVPNFLATNKELAELCYNAHVWLSYASIFLVVLHVIGALKHYFINQDNILQRMWR